MYKFDVFISILIPSYQRLPYIRRVLTSIDQQTYRFFEVIITDDSPDETIKKFIDNARYTFPVQYIKNIPPKGTPSNWTEGMNYAKGEWIKIIHDDDWLTSPDSLLHFVEAIRDDMDCIFSGYKAYYESTGKEIDRTISPKSFAHILRSPHDLFASNIIGPPSVLMFRKNMTELYDPALKWLVDIEGYIRMIQKYKCCYINKPLITMSYNDTQVTNECKGNPDIEIKEALIYYSKSGESSHKTLISYDAWWRLLRNLEIRSVTKLTKHAADHLVPAFLIDMLNFQRKIPYRILAFGIFSKLFMLICFILNNRRGFRYHH